MNIEDEVLFQRYGISGYTVGDGVLFNNTSSSCTDPNPDSNNIEGFDNSSH